MENQCRGCSAQSRDLGKRKMVLCFGRMLCARHGCLETWVPSMRVCVVGAWEVQVGLIACTRQYRGILSEIQGALFSAPSLPCALKKKRLKCHTPKNTTLYLKLFLLFNRREIGINI